MASGGSTVVQHSSRHPKAEGLSPAATAGSGKDNGEKQFKVEKRKKMQKRTKTHKNAQKRTKMHKTHKNAKSDRFDRPRK